MAKTVEDLLQENNELMRNFIQSQGNRVPTSNTSGTSSGNTGGSGAQQIYTAGLDSLGKLATGMYRANDAASDMTKILGNVPVAGGLLSNGFEKISGTLLVYNQTMNDAGNYGMSFNNNLGQMAQSMLGARMSVQDFQETAHKAGGVIMGFGGSASRNAETLLKLDMSLQESNVGRNLKLTGVSAKELNDVMLLTSYNQRNINMQDQAQVDAMAGSAGALAKELDMNARMFGKSREQQMKDIQAQQEKANVQAALDQMDTGARLRFSQLQGQVSTLGPAFQNLTSDIVVNNGARSVESTRLMSLLGTSGTKYQEAVLAYQNLGENASAEEKKKAADNLEAAKAGVSRRMAEEDFVEVARYNTGELGKMAGEVRMLNSEFQARRAAEEKVFKAALDKGEQLTTQQANIRIAEEMARRKQVEASNQQADAEKNKNDPAKAASIAINGMNDRVKDVSASLGTVMKGAIDATTKSLLENAATREIYNKVIKGFSQKEGADAAKEVLSGKSIGAAVGADPNYAKEKQIPETKKFAFGTPGVADFLNGGGNFSKMFEDFGAGTIAELHGNEMVARPDQLKGIVSKMMSNMQKAAPQMEQTMNSMSGQFGDMANNMSSQLGPMANQMASQVSSISRATLDDVKGELISLNKHIVELINHNVELVRNSNKTNRAISSNGNRLSA